MDRHTDHRWVSTSLSPRVSRRAVLGGMAAALCPLAAYAQAGWPSKPLVLVAVTPPGGNSDTYLRTVATPLADILKATVVVDNKPGAGGTIAGQYVLDNGSDGHAAIGASGSSHVLYPLLAEKVPYDAHRDFKPVALIGSAHQMLLVRPDSPLRSVADVVAAAKKAPGTLNFGSPGLFGIQRLAGELFQQQAGIRMVNVPNVRGSARMDVIAGHVDMMFDSGAENMVKAGTLRALAVTSATRSPQFPDVPTMMEQGVKDFEVSSWAGIFVSAKAPDEVVEKLNRAVVASLQTEAAKAKLHSLGMSTTPMTAKQFADFYEQDYRKWAGVVESQKLKTKIN